MGFFQAIKDIQEQRKLRKMTTEQRQQHWQSQRKELQRENNMLREQAKNEQLKASIRKSRETGSSSGVWAQKGQNLAAFINGTPMQQPSAPRRQRHERRRRTYAPRQQQQRNPFDALNQIKL